MRKRAAITAAVAAALAVTATPATSAAAGPRLVHGPGGVTIEIATLTGPGCRSGTVGIALVPRRDDFTVTYADYLAQAGGSSAPTDARKYCHIALKVHVPQGFTYAISSTTYRGYASLQTGATATQSADYYFQGQPLARQYSQSLNGPHRNSWASTDEVDESQLVYSPCGEARNLNIRTELRVHQGTSDPSKVSFIAMDSTDGTIKTTYHFAWKTCPQPA
ncbi:DUF4360 domain-containing protein [Actinomadura sp. 9N215]|uniref:DUF4360 domain-containing protein n=1 Tax=Actinomadura sp. 9N215 TaxID=3375150 RepID=UPI00379B4B81